MVAHESHARKCTCYGRHTIVRHFTPAERFCALASSSPHRQYLLSLNCQPTTTCDPTQPDPVRARHARRTAYCLPGAGVPAGIRVTETKARIGKTVGKEVLPVSGALHRWCKACDTSPPHLLAPDSRTGQNPAGDQARRILAAAPTRHGWLCMSSTAHYACGGCASPSSWVSLGSSSCNSVETRTP